MQTILVGSTGFLGSSLRDTLQCNALDRSRLDLLHPDPVAWRRALKGHDRVLICAAIPDVERCHRDPETSHAVNVAGTCALIDAAWDVGAVPVFFSSDYVFRPGPRPKVETSPREPQTTYGRQKLAVEFHLESDGRPYLLLRTGKLVSATPHPRNILASMVKSLAAGEPVPCFSDQVVTPLFIEDIAPLLDAFSSLRGAYHLGSRTEMTREQLGLRLARAMGRSPGLVKSMRLAEAGLSEPRPTHNTLDCSKIERETGFRFSEIEDFLGSLVKLG